MVCLSPAAAAAAKRTAGPTATLGGTSHYIYIYIYNVMVQWSGCTIGVDLHWM